jgi:hypothetical protein
MAFAEEYREMIVDAGEAIGRLLDLPEGEWTGLRASLRMAYRHLGEELVDVDAAVVILSRRHDDMQIRDDRKRWWRRRPRAYRENLVLDVLADDRLSVMEMATRVAERLEWDDDNRTLYETHIAPLVKDLLARGDLDRVREPRSSPAMRTTTCFRYFRNQPLSGPIAELERAYQDEAA